jgi:uncharacterized protein with beta-barrel porin domain
VRAALLTSTALDAARLTGATLAGAVALIVAMPGAALADCAPAAANNVTATCTGTTTNQGGGAPGTSAGIDGYGTGVETGVTVNVAAGAGNTVTGANRGIFLGDLTVTNNAGAIITGGNYGIVANTGAANVTNSGSITGTSIDGIVANTGNVTVTNNAGASIMGARDGIVADQAAANVTNSGSIFGGTLDGIFARTNVTVTNNAGANITGGQYGVRADTGTANVTNFGSIAGTSIDGILSNTGNVTVTNNAGASITGARDAIVADQGASNVTNFGSIAGGTLDGVFARTNATVTNNAGASITGGRYGVRADTGTANVTNFGSITGTSDFGIFALANATVTNNASASIMGGQVGIQVNVGGGSSVFNAGSISGATAAIRFAGTGNTLTLAPGSAITGNVLGTGSDTFQLGGSGTASFDVSQIGAAAQYRGFGTFNKIDASTWTLTGTNSAALPWTINAGTLSVNGTMANSTMTVNAGGTLAGTGTVGNTSINSGGIFAPGSGVAGTSMTVAGNLAFQSGALYLVQVNPATASMANVTGTAALAGSVQAAFAPGSYVVRSYDILHAAGGLGGTTFSGVSGNVPAGFSESLSYTSTDVFLNLTAALGAGAGPLNQNQQNVANAINNFFNNGGTLPPNFLALFGLTGGNLANALTLLSGETATGAQQGAFQLGNQFLNVMLDPFVDGRAGIGGAGGPAFGFAPERPDIPDDIALAYSKMMKAPLYKAPPLVYEPRWTVWGAAYGGYNKTSGDPLVTGSHDLTARAGGVAAGLDYRLAPETFVGFALAGGGTNWALAQGLGGGKSDAFQAGAYAATRAGPAYVAASLAFANHWMSTDRFAAFGDHLTASFNAQSIGGRVESGWRFASAFGAFTPYAALQAQSFRTPTYSEVDVTAGGFGLTYNNRTATDTRSELGARFDKQFLIDRGALLALRGRLAWAHDWVSDPSLAAVFQTLPGASFIVNGATPAKNSALASAGAELKLANGVALIGKLDGEFASHAQTYAGTGTLRVSW